MPNGDDKNLIRFLAAIDGFRSRYKKWPARVVLEEGYIRDLQHILSPADYAKVTAKVEIVPKAAVHIRATGGEGEHYDYGLEGFTDKPPDVNARQWLEIA